MKKLLSLVSVCLMVVLAGQVVAEEYQPGVHYKVLEKPVRTDDPAKVEVVEMFGYWCPHCNHLEEMIVPWKKTLPAKTYFKPIPVVFRKNQTDLAKGYYVAEMLGVLEQTHEAFFNLIHKQGENIRNREQLAHFFKTYGVSQVDFDKAYDSFALNGMLSKGKKKARDYQISGVPTLIVNGKYVVTASTAGSQPDMLKVVDYLIQKELIAAH